MIGKRRLADFREDLEEIAVINDRVARVNREMDKLYEEKMERIENYKENMNKAKLGSAQKLTDRELNFIQNEFTRIKEWEKSDFEEIDKLLTRLKFFARLEIQVRIGFYKQAKFIFRAKGDIIFNFGDIGDLMYVIIKGHNCMSMLH